MTDYSYRSWLDYTQAQNVLFNILTLSDLTQVYSLGIRQKIVFTAFTLPPESQICYAMIVSINTHGFAEEILALEGVICEMKKKKSLFEDVLEEILSIVKNPIVAGGFAVSFYTKPRATADLDVVGLTDIATYSKQLESRGYKREMVRLHGLTLEMFTKGDHGIDFMFFDNDSFEKSVLARAVTASQILGHPIRIISLEDLIIMKSLSSRDDDQNDLKKLTQLPHNASYVQDWLSKLKKS